MSANETKTNGWTAVPVSGKQIFQTRGDISTPTPVTVADVYFPSDVALVADAQAFVKKRLSPEAFNHSMRVFYWGYVIGKQLLPEYAAELSPVTWALTCLLHDIGTAEDYFTSTRMSFDIHGDIKAMEILRDLGSTKNQAEAVAEAIIHHEDMGVDGTTIFMGQLIQLATLYDNVGKYESVDSFGDITHETTRDNINKTYPSIRRCPWFAEIVRKEEGDKPWCHTTHIPNFDKEMEANTLHE
ncbi:cyanamide hydratase [Aureobasidium pullulans EXF-150]|uniref:Cyanamide hydratase n=1 Tax=Aureobasidium pullulans EXF-150 TaxID=1043002 RepID=A0A074XS84_AURPU|nr:cyanamide hydratase [Aureobasidium pullulans EXF-150]KEQ88350.1 cyanamide hydratase [Aureobasidium pullulans EXF-150]